MRIALASILLLFVGLAACSATPPNTESAVTSAQAEATPDVDTPPPRAAGKISADMVGKVSPVPAFRGFGEHFNIEVHANEKTEGDMRHHVRLIWGSGSYKAEGALFYRGPKPAPKNQSILLDGTLETKPKSTTIQVEIIRKSCVDDANQPYPQTVVVTLGNGTRLNGCGELAVY